MTDELPDVPDELPELRPEHLVTIEVTHPLARAHDLSGSYPRRYDEPRWFGPHPDKGRFDHHPAGPPRDHEPDHGVVYLACDDPLQPSGPLTTGSAAGNVLDVVIAEHVQDGDELVITPGLTFTVFTAADPLQVLDLRSSWGQATRVGTHLSTAPHRRTQPWARAIRTAYPQLHGVLYVPATGGRAVALALNEKAVPALTDAPIQLSRRFGDDAFLPIAKGAASRLDVSVSFAR